MYIITSSLALYGRQIIRWSEGMSFDKRYDSNSAGRPEADDKSP